MMGRRKIFLSKKRVSIDSQPWKRKKRRGEGKPGAEGGAEGARRKKRFERAEKEGEGT